MPSIGLPSIATAVFNGGMVSSVIAMKSERTLRSPAGVVDDQKGKGQGLSASQDHNAKSSERQIYCDALFLDTILRKKRYF